MVDEVELYLVHDARDLGIVARELDELLVRVVRYEWYGLRSGVSDVNLLLAHYKTLYKYLGGDPDKVLREWGRLKLYVMRTDTLRVMQYTELYERLYDQSSDKSNDQHYYNILLLVAIVGCISVDTSICERGFSLMNNLKSVRRTAMGDELLRILMTICSLGKEWEDPSKIPVDEIVEEWRSGSSRGRYEAAMWKEANLEMQA